MGIPLFCTYRYEGLKNVLGKRFAQKTLFGAKKLNFVFFLLQKFGSNKKSSTFALAINKGA